MTDAYKCDKCGEFSEGSPCRRKYRSYTSVGITGWTSGKTKTKGELCPGCAESVDEQIAELLGSELDG
jgi:hypothetical protein